MLCAALLVLTGMAPVAARSPTIALRAQTIHGASTVPCHRSTLLRVLVNSKSFGFEGGQNSPASSPEYFVEAWQAFQSQAAPRQADDSSFDAVLATVEAAQVQLVNGQPGPFKAWSHGEDVTLVGGLGGAIATGWTQVSERLDWVETSTPKRRGHIRNCPGNKYATAPRAQGSVSQTFTKPRSYAFETPR